MKTTRKGWLIAAVCLILSGIIISVFSLWMINFNFKNLSTEKLITNEQNITEDFNNIKIDANTSDIKLVRSKNNECKVVAVETENIKHTVTVNNDTLSILVEDSREWYEHIGISFGEMLITIYLPKDNYDLLNIEGDTSDITIPQDFMFTNIEIETDTGDVLLSSATQTLDISTDTGDIEIGNVNLLSLMCNSINLESDTGDIKIWHTVAAESINVQSDTGDVWFGAVESQYVNVVTATGDVQGDLYTAPKFITKTATGTVKVPSAKTDDVFKITTDTGDIYFKVVK